MIIHLHVEFLILDPNTNIQKEKLDLTHLVRHAIITEKVNICLTLFEPLPPPYFLLSKAKASCSLTPPPPVSKVSKTCTLTRALVLMACLMPKAF